MLNIKAVSDKQRNYAMTFVNNWFSKLDYMAQNWTRRGTEDDESSEACAEAVSVIEDGKNQLVNILQNTDAGTIIDLAKGNVHDDLGRRAESGRKSEIENAAPALLISKTEKDAQAAYKAWYDNNEKEGK